MEDRVSALRLLRSRRFLPYFVVQALGAFNDNLFKNALLVLAAAAGAAGELDAHLLVNLAAGLFVLPFVLFAPLAGQLADKCDKAWLMRRVKAAEIAVMGLGAAFLAAVHWGGLLFTLFLMGTQSAFFGPLKFAILPDLLARRELLAGNALVALGTFAAILAGTLAGSLAGGLPRPAPLVGGAVLGVAVAGFLASLWVPPAPPAAPGLALHLNPLAEYRQLWRLARERRDVWLALLGVAWFWLLGAAYLTQLPNLVVAELGAGPAVLAALLVAATLGIGIGALACQRLAGGRIELGLVPLGALGVTAFGVHLASAVADGGGLPQGVLAFLGDTQGRAVTFALFAIGFCGGLYVVPLNAAIQARTAPERRARVIAALNIASSLFMVAGSAAGAVLLGLFDLPLPAFFLGLALANGLVTLIIFFQLPEFAARLLIWLLVRALYRVRVVGLERVPARGAALLVCNHVSYVDGLIVAGAIPRPVRFVMARSVWRHPLLHGLFRLAGAIPICPKGEDPDTYAAGMAAIRQALERGELVCVFPEGRLTPDGELGPFRPGILKMLSLVPVPVVPMALSGLWGSLFSLGRWRLGRGPVVLSIGRPVPPEEVRLEALRATVEALRGERR